MSNNELSYLDTLEIDGLDETYAENTDVDEIETANQFLVDFVIDGSGSMDPYEQTMPSFLETYKSAIANSKQSDEIMVSKTIFNDQVISGGYVFAENMDTSYTATGCTKLFDAIVHRRKCLLDYMNDLRNNGTNVRGALIILSDGMDNDSRVKIGDARNAIEDLRKQEIMVAFIAFGQDAFGIADKLGISPKNVMEVDNNESELRKVIALVSKSAISASKRASAGLSDDSGFFDV